MNKNSIYIILIFIILVIGTLFLIEITNSKEPLSFKIIDNNKECLDILEEIYRTDKYVYYLNCSKKDDIIIRFSDKKEYSLEEALNKKILNINELIANGLKYKKYSIDNEITDEYIEEIPENAKKFIELIENNEVLMNNNEITNYNEKIKEKADMLYDIDNIKSLTKDEILKYINSYNLPSLPKYNKNVEVTKNDTQNILNNRSLEKVTDKENLQKGLIIKRANLRSFPSDIHFNSYKNIDNFDRLQETELLVNTPLLILHESRDNLWYFVITPTYFGWVKKENIALATDEDYDLFINSKDFGIITALNVNVENINLDMSVKLPYLGYNEEGYKFLLPVKDSSGYAVGKTITIPKNKAHIGYLPYTYKNLLIEAFKYEGVNYSWSGLYSGVDCSSYVSNIYRTFGFNFPRNTSSQNKSVGKIIDVSNKTSEEKLKLIETSGISLLYQDGHVMLYIGKINQKNYVIHASGTSLKVGVTELENSSHIKNINKIVVIDKTYLD